MRKMLDRPAVRLICWYLAFTISGFFLSPVATHAAFISPSETMISGTKADAIEKVTETLEKGILREKLSSLGLSSDEIRVRLDSLTPEERQAVLDDVDRIQAGGNGIVTILVVILLVVLILKLLDKEIVIK